MKILQLIQRPQWRGAEMFASQLSNHLMDSGHGVVIISLFPGDASLPFKGRLVQLNRPAGKRLLDVNGWHQLAKYIHEIRPDVVQANAGDTLKFGVFSKLLFGWKTPLIFRNANKVSDFVNSGATLFFNKFLTYNIRHVISVSELCRKDFVNTYSFEKDNTTMVPIGIELEEINGALPPDLIPIFENRKVLVNVASFVPEKNHMGLLRIVKALVEAGEDVNALLIGDGKLRPLIQEQVLAMGLESRVFLVGNRRGVLSILANANGFILPSKIEGLPGVLLEAMYCRLPVVAYAVGGIAEIVKPRDTGWLVKPGDEAGFVAAIRAMLHSDDLNRIKDNAYNMVVKEFDNKRIAKRFLDVYNMIR